MVCACRSFDTIFGQLILWNVALVSWILDLLRPVLVDCASVPQLLAVTSPVPDFRPSATAYTFDLHVQILPDSERAPIV